MKTMFQVTLNPVDRITGIKLGTYTYKVRSRGEGIAEKMAIRQFREEVKAAWEMQIMTKYDITYEQVSSMVADGVLTLPQYYDIEVVSITKISEDI